MARRTIRLRKYQQEAYRRLIDFVDGGVRRMACVMPTKAGKSYIMFKYARDHPDQQILLITRSRFLYRVQLAKLYQAYPDASITNIVCETYSWIGGKGEPYLDSMSYDAVFFDECHHAGSDVQSAMCRYLMDRDPEMVCVGMEATPTMPSKGGLDVTLELFGGNYIANLDLPDAYDLHGYSIKAPRIVRGVYGDIRQLEGLRSRLDLLNDASVQRQAKAIYERARRCLDDATNMPMELRRGLTIKNGRYIVFCTNLASMRSMMGSMRAWLNTARIKAKFWEVHSQLDEDVFQVISDFETDDTQCYKFLFSVDQMLEGYHCDIDGLVVFRPTGSINVFTQMMGRATATGDEPRKVVLDFVNNIDNANLTTLRNEAAGPLVRRGRGGAPTRILVSFKLSGRMMQIKGAMAELERLYLSKEHERSLDYVRKNANRIRCVTEDLAMALRDGQLSDEDLALASSAGLRIVPETLDVTHPAITLDWSDSNDLTPRDVTYEDKREVAWHCHACGHDWSESVVDRVTHATCPECAKTLERRARSLKIVSRREHKARPAA